MLSQLYPRNMLPLCEHPEPIVTLAVLKTPVCFLLKYLMLIHNSLYSNKVFIIFNLLETGRPSFSKCVPQIVTRLSLPLRTVV